MITPRTVAVAAFLALWGAGLTAEEDNSQQSRPRRTSLLGQRREARQSGECDSVFAAIQNGLLSGSIGSFSGQMASQVYVNLRDGEKGYFSPNQARYLLENYLKSRKLLSLRFSTIGELNARPYATGSATFAERGERTIAQVYVSLARSGERWVITQINIY